MTTTKKFIQAISNDVNVQNFIQNDNLMEFAVINVEPNDETVKFDTLTSYFKLESFELDRNQQFAFELFTSGFRNSKNAVASLLKHIETGKPLTAKTFEQQAKLAPKVFTDKMKSVRTFTQFMNLLNPEQQATLCELSRGHFEALGIEETGFEFFHLNGENGITLTRGEFVKIKDNMTGYSVVAKVLQASPKGYVSLVDTVGMMTLSKETAKSLVVVPQDKVPAESLKLINEVYNQEVENGETSRIVAFEKAEKLFDREVEVKKKEDAKKEKEEKSTTMFTRFSQIKLETAEKIEKFVKSINTNKSNLLPSHKVSLAEKIKQAKDKLKEDAKKVKELGAQKKAKAKAEAEKKVAEVVTTETSTENKKPKSTASRVRKESSKK